MSRAAFASFTALKAPAAVISAALIALGITSGPAAAEPLVAHEVLSARTGLRVIAVQAPNLPWAVVQLHVRTAGQGVPAEELAATQTALYSLAEGRTGRGASAAELVRAAGGETRVGLTVDGIVVSDGIPAGELDTALGAMEQRLRGRRSLAPAAPALPLTGHEDPALPWVVRQLMAPGHPYGFPVAGGADEAAVRGLIDRTLRRENAALVVVSPLTPSVALYRVNRHLRTYLPRGELEVEPPPALVGNRVVEGGGDAVRAAGPGLWLPLPADPGEAEALAARRRVSLEVLAVLLDGRAHGGAALDWLALPVAESGARPERERVSELEAIGRSLDERSLKAARRRVRTERARALRTPEGIAFALGRGWLLGSPDVLDEEDRALRNLSAPGVAAVAQGLAHQPRIAVRPEEAQ